MTLGEKKEVNPYDSSEFHNVNALKKKAGIGKSRNRLLFQKQPENYTVEINGKRYPIMSDKGNPVRKDTKTGKKIIKILRMKHEHEPTTKSGGITVEVKDLPDGEAGAKPSIDKKEMKQETENSSEPEQPVDDTIKIEPVDDQVLPVSDDREKSREDMSQQEKLTQNHMKHGGKVSDDQSEGFTTKLKKSLSDSSVFNKVVTAILGAFPIVYTPMPEAELNRIVHTAMTVLGLDLGKDAVMDIKNRIKKKIETGEKTSPFDYESGKKRLTESSFEQGKRALGNIANLFKSADDNSKPNLKGKHESTETPTEQPQEQSKQEHSEPTIDPVIHENPQPTQAIEHGSNEELKKSDGIPDMKHSIHKQAVRRIFSSKGFDFTRAITDYIKRNGKPRGSLGEILEENRDMLEQYNSELRISKLKRTNDIDGAKMENIELNLLVLYSQISQPQPKQYGVIIPAPAGMSLGDLQEKPEPSKAPRAKSNELSQRDEQKAKVNKRYSEKQGKLYNKPSQPYLRMPTRDTVRNTRLRTREQAYKQSNLPKGHFRF